MERVLEGESECLGVLFERHQGSLFGSFMKRTGDAALSEDLVQDTFYRAFKYRASFRRSQDFLPWLHQIARNVLYAALRKRGTRPDYPKEDGTLLSEMKCQQPSPYQLSAQAIERDRLYEAIEALPESERQLIVLRRIQDHSYEEMARILGCNVGPLKVRVHRAFKKLQKLVLEMAEETRC